MLAAEEHAILSNALATAKAGVLPHAVVGIRCPKERAFMRQGLRDALIPHQRDPGEYRSYLHQARSASSNTPGLKR
jgi:hypothetical protein